jgi:hypothetical protein
LNNAPTHLRLLDVVYKWDISIAWAILMPPIQKNYIPTSNVPAKTDRQIKAVYHGSLTYLDIYFT